MVYQFPNSVQPAAGDSIRNLPKLFLLLLLASSLLFLRPASAQTYVYLSQWGTAGTGNGQFNTPYGVAIDTAGNVFVADSGNSSIQKFNATGTFILRFGNTGAAPNRLLGPNAVALDNTNSVIYVADTSRNRIQRYSMTTGAATGTFPRWGAAGTGNGQFNTPVGIALDSSVNVYVADSVNNRIQKFTSTGTYTTKWGTAGTGNGQFNNPTGIAVDGSNNVYVVDRGNSRVQKFSSTGVYITKWGTAGAGNSQFSAPRHCTVDSAGNVYVADTGNNRIQKFTSTGTYVTQWGTLGATNGLLNQARGIAVSSGGIAYVADTVNNRIQRFGPLPAAPTAPGATAISTSAITFTWTDNSSDETGFKVYVDAGVGPPVTLSTTTAANATSANSTGLAVNAQYAFQVAATNANGDSTKTTNFQAWTLAATPLAPLVTNPGISTLDVAIASGDGNPAITTYALRNTDSGQYVQAGGALGATPVYQTAAIWGTTTVAGLNSQTTYAFTAFARNGASVSTVAGPAGSGTTLDVAPPNTLSILPATTGPTNATSVDFTVTFDEAVQNFTDASDVVILHSGTSHSGVTVSGGPSSYTVTVGGIAGDGSFTLAVNTASDVQDLSANPLASSVVSAPVTFDFTPPQIAIGTPDPDTTDIGPVTFAITYSGASTTSLDVSDITVNTTDTVLGVVALTGGGSSYTVTISSISGDGTLSLSIAAGTALDAAGNLALGAGPGPVLTVSSVPALSLNLGVPLAGLIAVIGTLVLYRRR